MNTLEERLQQSKQLKEKHPDYIPVIIKKRKGEKTLFIPKEKYLLPKHLHMSQFFYIIRQKMKNLDKNHAIFIFVEKKGNSFLVPMNTLISDIYNEYHSEDNFLYLIYSSENTFG